MNKSNMEVLPSSFRDPAGFVFCKDNILYRQINMVYRKNYEHLIKSGLYENLVNSGLLIPHIEVNQKDFPQNNNNEAYLIIQPELIPFISYPYEWCFSELKDAALLILEIQKRALNYGMTLKDCSAYNVQFKNCKPILIDTLSFEISKEGEPWYAYRQFCQHFLAPLVLMVYKDIRLNQLLKIYLDGIPLDLVSKLLPFYTYFKFSLFSHIHLQAVLQKKLSNKIMNFKNKKVSRLSIYGLIDNLEHIVRNLNLKVEKTGWADYYRTMNYTANAFSHKKEIIRRFLKEIKPQIIWDFGGNCGVFSIIASEMASLVVNFDNDPIVVEKNYEYCKKNNKNNILPLIMDLTNPSPSIGWMCEERMSFFQRGYPDCILALAFIHHLIIGNNLSFVKIAEFLSRITKFLIIEFVPKEDEQVRRMLASRNDIFVNYNIYSFENDFKKHFYIKEVINIPDTKRTIYLMIKKEVKK